MMNRFKILAVVGIFIFLLGCKKTNPLPDPLEAGWNKQAVCEVLEDNDEMRVLKCTFPPKVGHERHYHKPHFGYTLAGSKMKIEDASGIREVDVPTGYSYFNEGIEWHQALNIGDSTAVFLIIEPK
ncbi:MAG: cupin domain-containing protein [Flavobacteriaceae bacterium]|nr:cupin domain-containing protein [Flavobacteriaceae bacterium]